MASRHDYRDCTDDYCDQFACKVYREGYSDGQSAGYEAGYGDGQVDGYVAGYSDGQSAAAPA